MKLGLSTYTLTWSIGVPGYDPPLKPLSAVGLLELAKRFNISLVQIADNIALHEQSTDELNQLKQCAHDLQIELEIGTRGTDPQHLLKYLEICRLLDARIFRTLITTPDMEQAKQQFRQVLPEFEKAGVTIAVENHGLHTTSQLIDLFESLNSPNIGSCLDTVNSFSALEAPDKVIQDLVPYIVNLHIKDFEIKRVDHQMGFVVLGTAAGSGRLDIPALLNSIVNSGKNPNAILELWTPYTHSVEETIHKEIDWLNQSLEYLQLLSFES
jgi:3-oxoisoapionate decarboxylase